jgi:hypothetical protein
MEFTIILFKLREHREPENQNRRNSPSSGHRDEQSVVFFLLKMIFGVFFYAFLSPEERTLLQTIMRESESSCLGWIRALWDQSAVFNIRIFRGLS